MLIFSYLVLGCSSNSQDEEARVIAYVNGWEDNWGEHFEKAKKITHINYAFANITDGEVVEGHLTDSENLIRLNRLKEVNPNLKILISVGGWSWSGNFSDAALTVSSREKFAKSAVAFMQRHDLDGIDLDWEYPGLPGAGNIHREEDKENFTALLKLLRIKLDQLGMGKTEYLLTIATAASQSYLDHTNMREAHQYLDFINIMTYDFHGAWEQQTGHHANLTTSDSDGNNISGSVTLAVQEHIDAGIPAKKITVGVPFYGRWWRGVNPQNNGLYQSTTGGGGSFDYKLIADSLINANGITSHWDSTAQVPYLWSATDSLFVTYDNIRSIRLKVDYVKKNHLGGIMFWQFNGDNGELLETINTSF